ncbi:hypothetical protein EJB05_26864, partial [Eragrostis curvula]
PSIRHRAPRSITPSHPASLPTAHRNSRRASRTRSTAAAAGAGGARRPVTAIRRFPATRSDRSMATSTPSPPWADMPPELACLVLRHLPARVDRIRFAAVCPEWRAVAREARLPPPLPLLVLKDGTFYSVPTSEPLRFPYHTEDFTTACDNWLLVSRNSHLLLVDPFSGATMTLPAPCRAGGDGDYSDSSEDTVARTTMRRRRARYQSDDSYSDDEGTMSLPARYRVRYQSDDSDSDEDDASDNSDVSETNFTIIKLIVCSPHLVAALFSSNGCCRIAVCRPGASLWSVLWNRTFGITDIAFYQGKLYVVDDDESLLAVHIVVDDSTGNPRVARFVQVINNSPYLILNRMVYLVKSRGSLLMVCRRNHVAHRESEIHTYAGLYEPELVAFEADFGQSQWVEVTTLRDDQALFLGPCSRDVCMLKCDMTENRVWFLDDYKNYQGWGYCYDDMKDSSTARDCSMKKSKLSTPLPMISWKGCRGAGAAWLFPTHSFSFRSYR